MKYLSKIILFLAVVSTFMVACTKEAALPLYSTGNAPVLSSSKTTIAATAADSNLTAVTFSWTDPSYATDSSNVKYVLEIDSTGRNFSKAVSMTVTGKKSKSLTGKELNNILLGFGFNFNIAYGIDLRVTSSYANNNDRKVSNTVKVSATPYKVPPKVDLPASGKLFLVGGASDGGWNNPVPTPTQEFARIDETTFVGVFNLKANDEFLVLPVNGDWSQKFATPSNTVAGIQNGGDFKFYTSGGDNFKSPSTAGMYLITFDFQRGKFTIVPFTGPDLATNLFMVGNATPGGWNNPVPVPSQQFTRLNSCQFELSSLAITGGNEYLLLPENGNWGKKYAIIDNSIAGVDVTGTFQYYTSGGSNFKAPAASGNYKFEINFATAKYKVTKL
jgi:hypothetical protein